MGKRKEAGLTTNNLDEFKGKVQSDRAERVMRESMVGSGEVDGKSVNWNYSEGKSE